jgi:Flp pilus assembly protein TadB
MKAKFYGDDEKIRKQQLELVSMLNRWYQVKEDLMFAFEKCAQSQIGEPTKGHIKDFVARVKGGLSMEKSLDLFAESFSNRQFKSFSGQIRFNLKHRGNIGELLDNMETQFARIDEESTRRKITSSRDRHILSMVMAITPVLSVIVVYTNPSARKLFFEESIGIPLIIISVLSYICGLTIFKTSSKFNE